MGDVIEMANVSGEDVEELKAALAPLFQNPNSPGASRTLLVPQRLLDQLRDINRQVTVLQSRQMALVEGYAAGLDYDRDLERINVDIETGIVTISEKVKE